MITSNAMKAYAILGILVCTLAACGGDNDTASPEQQVDSQGLSPSVDEQANKQDAQVQDSSNIKQEEEDSTTQQDEDDSKQSQFQHCETLSCNPIKFDTKTLCEDITFMSFSWWDQTNSDDASWWIHFKEGQIIWAPEGELFKGSYKCENDELAIYLEDSPDTPIAVEVDIHQPDPGLRFGTDKFPSRKYKIYANASDEPLLAACTKEISQVCGKKPPFALGASDHYRFHTFPNRCGAYSTPGALISYEGECRDLEDLPTNAIPPIRVAGNEFPEASSTAGVIEATIEGDILSVTLSHEYCGAYKEFHFYASGTFLESLPVQSHTQFLSLANEDAVCYNSIQKDYEFDLRPLKEIYKQAYQAEHGEIILRGVGLYTF